jgi:hypothetical protein
VRGDSLYVVGVGVSTPNLVHRIRPRPAILGLSDTQTSWHGVFAGATSGRYDVEVLGRRRFEVAGETVTGLGLRMSATYHGDVEGRQRTDTWLASDRALVLAESGRSVLRLGGAEQRLDYRNRLLSLEPRPRRSLP